MKISKSVVVLVIAYTLFTPQYAVTSINSISQFDRYTIDHDLVAARIYFKSKEQEKNKAFIAKYKRDNNKFEQADSLQPLVKFIKVNIEREHLKNIGIQYDISPQNTPAIILFRDGKKIALKHLHSGIHSEEDILAFIDDHFKEDLKKKIKRLRELQRRRAYYYHTYPHMYYGYPYSYYYGYPYYYRPWFGVGYHHHRHR